MNKFMAILCFINVMFSCFHALNNILNISVAAGYFVALLMCGVIQYKDELIASNDRRISCFIADIKALLA